MTTNYEMISRMTIDEMASYFYNRSDEFEEINDALKWLKTDPFESEAD